MAKDVIIACDFDSAEQTIEFLDKFGVVRPFVKIGMELYYAEGPAIVRQLKERGHRVFLDLKLHDIPTTVRKSMSVLSGLGVDIVNLHAAGSRAMMEAAVEGLTKEDGTRPLIIAVTMLTSIDEQILRNELLIDEPVDDVVLSYALNAKGSGLDGVVCSAQEAEVVHNICGPDFLTVTPGIRFAGDDVADQKRVMTPAQAREAGCDYIVVGRSVTKAEDPVAAYERCIREFLLGPAVEPKKKSLPGAVLMVGADAVASVAHFAARLPKMLGRLKKSKPRPKLPQSEHAAQMAPADSKEDK